MRNALPPVDYLMIGHITHDILPDGRLGIGGTASYATLTASALGRAVGLLTSIGPAVDLSIFDGRVSIFSHPSPATTTFENIYVDGYRRQYVYSVARPLTPAQLPTAWSNTPLVHLGPIMGECDPGLAEYFAGKAFVGLTPQGWLRAMDEKGQVFARPWAEAEVLLPLASAVVFSAEDVGGDWQLVQHYARQTRILVVTSGWEGGTLFLEGNAMRFPAPIVVEVDPTGAGDIFATAFFIALVQGLAPISAARFAACLAGRSVTRAGLASTPQRDDVAACPLSAFVEP